MYKGFPKPASPGDVINWRGVHFTCFNPNMAAPGIPNLNTLRGRGVRGGGRGRGHASSAGESSSSSEKEAAGRDKIVQQTDVDASMSRLSAVEIGYLEDPFAQLFVSAEPQRRFPIINRGTYVRSSIIDDLVGHFLSDLASTQKQIISLGAGSDTRFFRIMKGGSSGNVSQRDNLKKNLIYHEYDFPENVTKKKAIITRTSILNKLVGSYHLNEEGIDSLNYHLHSLDLRTLDKEQPIPLALRKIEPKIPTIIISECCLVYLDPASADRAAKYFTQFLFPPTTSVGLVLYEPILPDDAFGKVMVSNLAARGIVLQTLRKYGSMDAQTLRMRAYGLNRTACTDMKTLWELYVTEDEKRRVGALEMVDEVEEWDLLASHYCVLWARRDSDDRGNWAGWEQLETLIFSTPVEDVTN